MTADDVRADLSLLARLLGWTAVAVAMWRIAT